MINVGIVGLGFMAATHIRAYQKIDGVRISAICNPSGRHLDGDFSTVAGNIAGASPLQLDMAHVKPYRNMLDLVGQPELDLIDICAPTPAHPELAMAALRAGKNVLCEKPLARNSTIARQILEVATNATGFLMPAMCLRFWPEWAWLKDAIQKNTYGRVLSARFRRVAEPPGWGHSHFHDGKQSGGALLDLHIHDTDFIQYCFGRPRAVFSTGYSKFSGEIDHVVTQYMLANDAIVHAEGAWAMTQGFGFNMSYTVNFERATADYDIGRGKEALRLVEEGADPKHITVEEGDGFVGELKHALDCIRNNTPPSVVTAKDALGAIEICEAEEKSVKSGQITFL